MLFDLIPVFTMPHRICVQLMTLNEYVLIGQDIKMTQVEELIGLQELSQHPLELLMARLSYSITNN